MNKLLFGITVSAAVVAPVTADTFMNRAAFESAFPGLTTLDFEGYAPSGDIIQPAPDLSASGASFTDNDFGVEKTAISDSAFAFGTPSDVFFINQLNLAARIEFEPDVQAFGMNVSIGFGGRDATIWVFDALGNFVGNETIDTQSEPPSAHSSVLGTLATSRRF